MTKNQPSAPVRTAPTTPLERYLSILEIVAAAQGGLNLTELAQMMGLPKPTIHRLVGVLEAAGALETSGGRQRSFHIGRRMWRILRLGQNRDVAENMAQITCDWLAEQVKETSYIVKLGVDAVHTVARSVPGQGYRLHVFPGETLPAHAAASAKAIIAWQSDAVVDRVLKAPLPRLTENTLTDMDAVKDHLRTVREQGFAVCDREIEAVVMAYACPVHLPGAGVIYSVGITGPVTRLGLQPMPYWVSHLQSAAAYFANLLTQSEGLDAAEAVITLP